MSDNALHVNKGVAIMLDAVEAMRDAGRLTFADIIAIGDGMQTSSLGMDEEEFHDYSEAVTDSMDELISEGFSYARLAALVIRVTEPAIRNREEVA